MEEGLTTSPITLSEEIKLSLLTIYQKLKQKRRVTVLHMKSFKIQVIQSLLPKIKSLEIIIKEGGMGKTALKLKRFINIVVILKKKFENMNIRIAMKS